MERIDIGIESIDRIYHLADIHIRNYKRHSEYRKVFRKVYKYIKEDKTKNSIIYVAGDLVHSKLDMSPELVKLLAEFLNNLSDIAPTIVILGNHDLNLNNKSRLDAISPVIDIIKHKNLHFLKENKVYRIAQIGFNVMEVATDPTEFIQGDSFEAPFKIALHHGAVNRAVTDTGVSIINEEVASQMFAGHDLALLGDIHKRQWLNKSRTIAYPGSLIQQNYGETLANHGFLVWDIPSKECREVNIKNEYGYVTLHVEKGKLQEWSDDIPKYARLRVKIKDTRSEEVAEVLNEIRKRRKFSEIVVHREAVDGPRSLSGISHKSVRDVEYQNELITEYLLHNSTVSDKVLDAVRHLNRTINTRLEESEITRNSTWQPISFTFSNMFSYGEDNYVNFENMKGLQGIFAPNASGKSTLLDALCFCIFDKCSRTYKGSDVLNVAKDSFSCTFCFSLKGELYYIEKVGKKVYRDRVKVDITFYKVDVNGNRVLLNDEHRDATNKAIRKYIGTYEDFIMTALSTQVTTTDFINKTQRERKELLIQFLDLNIFDELYQIAVEESKEIAAGIKLLEGEQIEEELESISIQIEERKKEIEEYTTPVQEAHERVEQLQKEYVEVSSQIIKLREEIEPSYEEVLKIIQDCEEMAEMYKEHIKGFEHEDEELEKSIEIISKLLKEYSSADYYKNILQEESELQHELIMLKRDWNEIASRLTHFKDTASKLNTYQYDPACKFCVANPWVQQALDAKDQVDILEKELATLAEKTKSVEEKLVHYSTVHLENEKRLDLEKKLKDLELRLSEVAQSLKYNQVSLYEVNLTKKDAEQTLRKHEEQSAARVHNDLIHKNLHEIQDKLSRAKEAYKQKSDKINNVKIIYNVLLEKFQESTKKLLKRESLTESYLVHSTYLNAIRKDGVPYILIERTVPAIQQEVNNILEQIVDFNMVLYSDGKNINGNIVYGDDKHWPLELTSGMERFICSLAIRVALINLTTLPKPNFIAIDEGFGVLDSDNLNNIYLLFDYLKTQFTFMFCISHIDMMRDLVDTVVEINKVDGFSKIYHE